MRTILPPLGPVTHSHCTLQTTWFIQQASTTTYWAPTLATYCSKFQGYIGAERKELSLVELIFQWKRQITNKISQLNTCSRVFSAEETRFNRGWGGEASAVPRAGPVWLHWRQHLHQALKPEREPATWPLGWGEEAFLLSKGNSNAKGERNN